jgi:hypothetical protein
MSPAAAPLPVSGAWDAAGIGVKAGSTSDDGVASLAGAVDCEEVDAVDCEEVDVAAATAELATADGGGELATPEEGGELTPADEAHAATIKATIRPATVVEIEAGRTGGTPGAAARMPTVRRLVTLFSQTT